MSELNPYTFTDNPTESGVATCDTDVLNDDIMYLKWELSNTPSANQDLSNLTDAGNSKFQYAPFSINSGSVDASGSNITLYTPTEPIVIEETFVQPTLSANGTMGGSSFAVSASSAYSSEYAAWKAVDGSNSTFWQTAATTSGSFTFYNPTPLKVTSLYLSAYQTTGRQLKAGNIQGSNDNSTWTTITSWSGNTSLNLTVNMSSNTNFYNYYKINVTAVQANYAVSLRNLQITAVYQKTITVGTDLICNPCTITTADGRTKSFDSQISLDCSSLANGTYKILKDFEDGSLSTVSNLSISKAEPATPASGDYWLDYSVTPIVLKTYDDAEWGTDNDKVYIGNVTISSSAITDVFNVDFNATKEGQLVFNITSLNTAVARGTYTISLNNVLPNDGFPYEVNFYSYLQRASSGTGYVFAQLQAPDWNSYINLSAAQSTSQISIGSASVAITGRSIDYTLAGTVNPSNQSFSMTSYKRMGVV